jgi:hypothetical protein
MIPLALSFSFLAGCASHYSSAVVVHQAGAGSVTRPAPKAATYALFAGGSDESIETVAVAQGRQIGFIHASDGSLVAYAAGSQFAIPEGTYAWRVVPGSPGPPPGSFTSTGPEAAGARLGRVVVGTAELVVKTAVLMVLAAAGGGGTGR